MFFMQTGRGNETTRALCAAKDHRVVSNYKRETIAILTGKFASSNLDDSSHLAWILH